ncbi:MAG: hypothetical protein R3C59_07245 [Planctomycetaceae bacterium]
MPLFNKHTRRNRSFSPRISLTDVLENRLLLSASHSERNEREDNEGHESENEGNETHVGGNDDNGVNGNDDHGVDGSNDNGQSGHDVNGTSGVDDNGVSGVDNTHVSGADDNGMNHSSTVASSGNSALDLASNSSSHEGTDAEHNGIGGIYDDNGHENRGILTGVAGAIGEVQFESEVEHGVQQQTFEVDVRGLTPGSSHSVTVDGIDVGSVPVDSRGYGRLRLSSVPRLSELPLPANFPAITDSSVVAVGEVLSGTIVNVNPATQSTTVGTSGDSNHLRVNLVSTGTILGRAEFENHAGATSQDFQVEVWNGTSGDVLPVVVNGITVGQITVNALGYGALRLGTEHGSAALPANWPGIADGSVVTVGSELTGTFVGSGRMADASPSEFAEAYDLDHRLDLQAAANMFENWGGLGEKWLRGDDGWYFITPDGILYLWNGQKGANGDLVANLDVSFYDNPALLYDSSAANTATIDDDVARITAADLDYDLQLTSDGNYHENWGGLGERWMKGSDGWYFVTPDGSVYHWTKGSGMDGTLIAGLDSRYHADPTLLTNALPNLTVDEAAYAIRQGLNLQTTPSDFLNWGGRNEKWLRGAGDWYFITEDGGLYAWDGQPTASGTLITTLTPDYYNDLSLLTPASQPVVSDANSLLDNVFANVTDLLGIA